MEWVKVSLNIEKIFPWYEKYLKMEEKIFGGSKKYLVDPTKYLYLFLSSIGGSEQAEDDGEHDEAVEESEETDHEENLEEWGKDVRSGGDQQGQGQHGRAAAWT